MLPGYLGNSEEIAKIPRATVSRVDLGTVLTASGTVESAKNTLIECQLERLNFYSNGQRLETGGASTILWLIDEGTTVKKGDILCRLDASDYLELVRQQQIKTEQARAILATGKLNLEVAELALQEYQEGVQKQTVQSLEGQIALAESNLERSSDRLRWTARMLTKGYVAATQRSTAIRDEKLAENELLSTRWILKNLKNFGIPMTLKLLVSEVEKRRFEVSANSQRLTRTEARLKHYQSMVDFCTIRAPHDGFVIYAVNRRSSKPRIEPGVEVQQNQDLFLLPDLARMQVSTYFHESVAKQVRKGMRAKVRIEGLANRTLEGEVVSIGPLPTSPNWFSDEVKYFVGNVKLDSAPDGLLPTMTAEVEVDVDRRHDVLAVPTEAVAVENGEEVCYVAGVEGLTRRAVTLGKADRDLLEVTEGLKEGDQVVLNPNSIDDLGSMLTVPGPLEEHRSENSSALGSSGFSSDFSVE
ncbi:efflux RND transporter periplasmic adaptor subunit [Tundrisphaera lichenicola]|uniref:efflux RND transporter periplasmic adaptor subunit n=1 Tax=Tundrisphaera lichenicola TaxID=2029860 RepID=UPI003EB6EE96